MKRISPAVLLAAIVVVGAGCGGGAKVVHSQVRVSAAVKRGPDRARGVDVVAHSTLQSGVKDVPCPGDARRVGPARLRKLHAVTAVMCGDGFRDYPGRGQWEVFIRKVAVSSVARLQRYFEQPSRPKLPKNGVCTDNLVGVEPIAFVDAKGHWLVPRTPIDGCNHPLGLPFGQKLRPVRWQVVSVRKIRQQISAPALATGCDMKWGRPTAAQDRPVPAGPIFPDPPRRVRVCVYRTSAAHRWIGDFVRGRRLDPSQTQRLLDAMTGPAPTGSCSMTRSFAIVEAGPGRAVGFELGGCYRVAHPEAGNGTANASVVKAIVGDG